MAPDLNTLPPSRPVSGSNSPLPPRMAQPAEALTQSPSSPPIPVPHSPSHSLAATAALNAGIHNEESRRTSGGSIRRDADRARRRSSIRMSLNLNDPTVPAPGELQISPSLRTRNANFPSPRHERTPSLGELHQELENEQEAQVNRLLSMIRQQQAQIISLSNTQTTPAQGAAVDDSTPTSERSLSLPQSATVPNAAVNPLPLSPRPRQHGDLSRQSSYREQSRGNSRSPALRPVPLSSGSRSESNEWLSGGLSNSRDESAFYQAETQMLTRENQMLKMRIRELERQIADCNPIPSPHAPALPSNLATSPPLEAQQTGVPENTPLPPSATASSTTAS
ncbi:hypothetical protein EJ05DRAFT_482919 [Pseudovirgaria hyperparasitica]|uniref:Uncharacterized protein n=1 Tax=Pseudovirgaria hyperparasitica TaxID=470096 RepID=A0A6A6WJ39_9PEZI|nr:uncharacterized protein EJ05DRAFT_482919 [Pseudovirgaria hyperparasitica]KAF2762140.1 hypothetical protein EJ05DRAFT_482919 [Pseudovirgaria hyperparasitica]